MAAIRRSRGGSIKLPTLRRDSIVAEARVRPAEQDSVQICDSRAVGATSQLMAGWVRNRRQCAPRVMSAFGPKADIAA